MTELPMQVTISLQSAEGEADPDIDFATGALHVYVVREARDDAAADLNQHGQPILVMTTSR